MAIKGINNGESGSSVRNKLNQTINIVNLGVTTSAELDGTTLKFNKNNQNNAYNVDLTPIVGGGGGFVGDFTYSELQTLVSNQELQPGSYYLLTDFETIYDRPDYESGGRAGFQPKSTILTVNSGVIEPLLLLAISEDEFTAQVYSQMFPDDYLEYDFGYNLTPINNSPAKGKIVRRRDTDNNETNYDHRTITFKRYDRSGDNIYVWFFDSGTDDSVLLPTFGNDYRNNIFERTSYQLLVSLVSFDLENNVFGDNCRSNKFGGVILNNTVGNEFNNNTVGGNFNRNTVGNNFQNNTVGNSFISNTVGNFFQNNTVGNEFNNNTVGDSFISNTVGNNFRRNQIDYLTSSTDYTSATHVYGNYTCQIFRRSNNTSQLSYIDGTNTIQYTAIAA
jgi:hypothetical protein